jgi:hypothetical protein
MVHILGIVALFAGTIGAAYYGLGFCYKGIRYGELPHKIIVWPIWVFVIGLVLVSH